MVSATSFELTAFLMNPLNFHSSQHHREKADHNSPQREIMNQTTITNDLTLPLFVLHHKSQGDDELACEGDKSD